MGPYNYVCPRALQIIETALPGMVRTAQCSLSKRMQAQLI
jgi:hypothetical protein